MYRINYCIYEKFKGKNFQNGTEILPLGLLSETHAKKPEAVL
jgi:hypothetical protein